MGFIFAKIFTAPEYTIIACSAHPRYTAIMTLANGSSTAGPFCATTGVIRANTPIGAYDMIIATILYITSAMLSKKFRKGLPFSPTRVIPMPRNRAKAIVWSMFADTSADSALSGMMLRRVLAILGVSAACTFASTGMLRPAPGLITLPSISPITTAIAVVTR